MATHAIFQFDPIFGFMHLRLSKFGAHIISMEMHKR